MTDLRKTFDRVRREQRSTAKAAPLPPSTGSNAIGLKTRLRLYVSNHAAMRGVPPFAGQ
jgi:hypothetical protein